MANNTRISVAERSSRSCYQGCAGDDRHAGSSQQMCLLSATTRVTAYLIREQGLRLIASRNKGLINIKGIITSSNRSKLTRKTMRD